MTVAEFVDWVMGLRLWVAIVLVYLLAWGYNIAYKLGNWTARERRRRRAG